MADIPDAPWIRETEATGYCSAQNGAWWNNLPEEDEEEDIEMMTPEDLESEALDAADRLEENGDDREAEIVRQLIVRYRAARITANNYKKALEAIDHERTTRAQTPV